MELDALDIRIVERLRADGRLSLRQLAEELDISPSTASNRFHRLTAAGVIQGFRAELDYEQLGFDLTAVIEVKADSSRTAETVDRLKAKGPVFSLYEITGDTDIVLVCKFPDREAMNAGVKSFQQVDGVIETQTKVVLTAPLEHRPIALDPVTPHQ